MIQKTGIGGLVELWGIAQSQRHKVDKPEFTNYNTCFLHRDGNWSNSTYD